MKFHATILSLFLYLSASACDCDSIKGIKDADIVFKGKVIEIKRVEEPYIRYEVTFQIFKWEKGRNQSSEIVIDIPCLIDPCCGVSFKFGNSYQVLAYVENNRLKTNLCWANSKLR